MNVGLVQVAGTVVLEAVSIDDATDDNVTDIVANDVTLVAGLGIGGTRRLELADVATLSASTTTGGIQLHNESVRTVLLDGIDTGSGPVSITQRVAA